ncbi:ATP-binding protein [Streptomyces scabichelini]|nr:ATP-binding protein [Streptomyces scabichelini]
MPSSTPPTPPSADSRIDSHRNSTAPWNPTDNALRHNILGGWLRISTGMEAGQPILHVSNSGPDIPYEHIDTLLRPFQRLESRTGTREGHGLGLSIVTAIATAHDAELTAWPGPEGGLSVAVTFPAGRGPAD